MSKKILIIILLTALISIYFFLNLNKKEYSSSQNNLFKAIYDKSREKVTVRGNSLNPIIKAGDCVYILKDYYQSNRIKREDIIAYNFVGNENLIIKIVKALPGDKFEMRKGENNSWSIAINNNILKNSEGEIYSFSDQGSKMLRLYADAYPEIPQNSFLILGNNPRGSLDSSRFGLASRDNVIGKVKKCTD